MWLTRGLSLSMYSVVYLGGRGSCCALLGFSQLSLWRTQQAKAVELNFWGSGSAELCLINQESLEERKAAQTQTHLNRSESCL